MAPLSPDKVGAWVEYSEAPWGRLRTELISATLDRHAPPAPAHVLDVGCGLGEISVRFANAGSDVVAADASAAMIAEAERHAGTAPVRWLACDLDATARALAGERFDLVLCHNVLGYVADPAAATVVLASLLAPGGTLSLTLANRTAEPLRLAFGARDLAAALHAAQHGEPMRQSGTLDVESVLHDVDEAIGWLDAAGLEHVATAGHLLINHYLGAADRLNRTADGYTAIRDLELALAERDPYRRIAPFFQLVAVSGTAAGT